MPPLLFGASFRFWKDVPGAKVQQIFGMCKTFSKKISSMFA